MGNSTDVTGNIDTSGTGGSDASKLTGITSIFDADAPGGVPDQRGPRARRSSDRIVPGGDGTPDIPDTSGTTDPVAGYTESKPGDYDTGPAGKATGHVDTSTPGEVISTPLADLTSIPADGDDDKGEAKADEDPAKAYDSMTIPKIMAHAKANDHEFGEDASVKADYIQSLVDAGVAPPK